MRIIRAITDLPWWMALPMILVGNAILISGNLISFMIGFSLFIFGCWGFSKLFKISEDATPFRAFIGIPLTALILYFLNSNFIDVTDQTLYVLRLALGLVLGFISTQGFVK